jgi:hypothetical protein
MWRAELRCSDVTDVISARMGMMIRLAAKTARNCEQLTLDSSSALKYLATRLSLGNGAARRNAAGKPDIAANG